MSDFRLVSVCVKSRKRTSSTYKGILRITISSRNLLRDALFKSTSRESSLLLTRCLQGVVDFLSPYSAHPTCCRWLFRVKAFQLWSQTTNIFVQICVEEKAGIGYYWSMQRWGTHKQGTAKVLKEIYAFGKKTWDNSLPRVLGKTANLTGLNRK